MRRRRPARDRDAAARFGFSLWEGVVTADHRTTGARQRGGPAGRWRADIAALLLLCGALALPAAALEIADSQRFVRHLYGELYLREADAAGAAHWRQQLDSGAVDALGVLHRFLRAAEYDRQVAAVARLYRATLGRLPDRAGQAFWLGRLRAPGGSLEAVSAGLLASDESQALYGASPDDEAFLRTLYQLALGRDPDDGGLAHWLDALAAGASRAAVVQRVAASVEHREISDGRILVADLARSLLGRDATAAELAAAPPSFDVELLRKYLWQGSSVSLAVIGLGDSIRVTDSARVTIGGLASSLLPVEELRWHNLATGAAGTASGAARWEAELDLSAGDNRLRFTAVNRLGAAVEREVELTYDPAMALASPLHPSRDVAYLGDATPLSFELALDPDAGGSVQLLRLDGDTQVPAAAMHDDGQGVDELPGDGIYSAAVVPAAQGVGNECYRARVVDAQQRSYLSETRCLWVAEHLRNGDVSDALLIAEAVETDFANAPVDLSPVTVAQAVAAALPARAEVARAGYTDAGAVWWVSGAGILGAYREPEAGSKAAGAGAGGNAAAPPAPGISDLLYPVAYLADRSRWQPARADGQLPALGEAGAGVPPALRSFRGALISPFIDDPLVPDNGFGSGDDFFGAWASLGAAGSCAALPVQEALNGASGGLSLADFAAHGSTGYLHISSHGDQYFEDLLEGGWDDSLGPASAFAGSRGQVLVDSGIALGFTPGGALDFHGLEDDLVAKRIAVTAGGRLLLAPAFFDRYLPRLPASLVVLSHCRSLYNDSLANAFLAHGAGAVLGFSDSVALDYAQALADGVVLEMLAGQPLGAALDATRAQLGAEDGDATPAFPGIAGNAALRLAGPEFGNGDFERGSVGPWRVRGGHAVLARLGNIRPAQGLYMGAVSTGRGAAAADGSWEHSACLPPAATQLSLQWNLASAEFGQWCDSGFQDRVSIELCTLDSRGAVQDCEELLSRTVADFCARTTPVGIAIDGRALESSGWQTLQADVSAYAGSPVLLRAAVEDTLDRVYDSLLLIDALRVD